MILASLRKHSLILGILAVFLCVSGPCANAQEDDLIKAAGRGDLARVKALLDAKADVNAKLEDCTTALIFASQKGYLEVVRALLDEKADVNTKGTSGATALTLASMNGNRKILDLLKKAALKPAEIGKAESAAINTVKGVKS